VYLMHSMLIYDQKVDHNQKRAQKHIAKEKYHCVRVTACDGKRGCNGLINPTLEKPSAQLR